MHPTRSALAGLCLAAALVVATSAPAGAQAATTCTVSSTDQVVDSEEQALLGLINNYRWANGKNALVMGAPVTTAAVWFSRDMATKNYFPYNHVDSNGRTIDQRLRWCGVSFSNWAENIFAGSPGAQAVFDAWRNSSIHNANMLRDGVTAAGIARAYGAGSTYGWYWTLDVTNTATTTVTTAPPTTTTTTTRPPTTTTTTRPPATTAPAPGSPEWWAQYLASLYGR